MPKLFRSWSLLNPCFSFISAMTMAIPVAKRVRDVFYKHRASGMIGHDAMFIGLVVAELPYLLLMAVLYVFIYCATVSIINWSLTLLFVVVNSSEFPRSCRHNSDWTLDIIGKFYVVCMFFPLAHGIVFLLCAMLHVSR